MPILFEGFRMNYSVAAAPQQQTKI